ncbi:NmrA family NAD(P)-binding protein [Mycobacterium sp. ZZG]
MLLITGPSGNVGRELVETFRTNLPHRPWRVASRHPEQLRDSVGNAAQVCRFDFFERATWADTLREVETLFLLFPVPGNRAAREAVIPFIDAAESAGCRHVVYVSVFGADRAPFIPHYKVEAALKASSMGWTFLRCSFFMQNLHRAISTHGIDIAERGELFIPAGRGRTSFIDARDAAAVAALALTDPTAHHNVIYHLTGPAALTMHELAASMSEMLGYPVTYTHPGLARIFRGNWCGLGLMSSYVAG